ncbi:hypothetical protein H310_13071 [Aphanomyces invadans]|uniref:Phosphatidate phosphatase APP1 catalytic domain-containing protein n=1 Tax=Aphanomyces invadans TaxID=157072 RepID=A0A024TGY5_9STRA|nr:hypothetical protein H310_13071 [Aphanomyces invadans]ETV92617.1 hypothetical protein H310_13071 [Aphanomyces invadans]|eukprot:XP_008878653.1 hypothetical protein H310_13071 [Aphanomyces invadans]
MKQRTTWKFRQQRNSVVFQVDGEDTEDEMYLRATNVPLTDEKYCHNILADAPPDVLNGILGATSPKGSDSFCSTMTGFMLHTCSSTVRAKVLDIITNERLVDVNLANRGIIIRAMQQHLVSPWNRQKADFQKAAFNVLKGTYGSDLTLLKEDINSDFVPSLGGFKGGDLHQLIYGCRDLTQVVSVVQHIAVEALKVGSSSSQRPLIKIMSDIDDTLFAGWVDARYPGHTLYPGVTKLFQCISRGVNSRGPSVTFLTARPRGWFSFGRNLTADRLVSMGLANPTVLNGSVRTGVNAKKIAGLKLDNFVRYTTLFPEYKFVFFGDSGQGDALLASQMRALFPDKVVATFIHDIDPASPLTGDGGLKADYSKNGVHFYNNYAAAGILAFEMGLISKEDATSVVQSCHDELDSMTFTGRDSTTKHAQRKEELNLEADRWSHAFRPTT